LLVDRTKKLVKFGAKTLAIACNTAHLLLPQVSKVKGAHFISMIDEVVTQSRKLRLKRIGLLATPTTIKMKVYQSKLKGIFTPLVEDQNRFEIIIRDVISGKTTKNQINFLENSTKSFIEVNNLDGIILGCTELPLVFPKEKFIIPILDSLEILAEALINLNVKI